ncbi:MAG: ABC transporter permease, partial [Gammaproteobacteria bacterium]
MQLELQHSALIRRIADKEVTLFFASPIAYLFLASFAAVTLFIFFWGEAFFSRNIADVRPLFEWMPILLIFLASTLTMRLWSEERRTGTLEHVYTQPVPLWHFVIGKFAGCLFLLVIALAMTLPLPLTVSIIGDLDWGPVWAGYLATFLLGAAYLSIGLFVSARSDNQIVSLISAVAL